jgi:hypothetical protein
MSNFVAPSAASSLARNHPDHPKLSDLGLKEQDSESSSSGCLPLFLSPASGAALRSAQHGCYAMGFRSCLVRLHCRYTRALLTISQCCFATSPRYVSLGCRYNVLNATGCSVTGTHTDAMTHSSLFSTAQYNLILPSTNLSFVLPPALYPYLKFTAHRLQPQKPPYPSLGRNPVKPPPTLLQRVAAEPT